MLPALLLAALTGICVWKKRWGWATFCGMMFLYFLWLAFLTLISLVHTSTF